MAILRPKLFRVRSAGAAAPSEPWAAAPCRLTLEGVAAGQEAPGALPGSPGLVAAVSHTASFRPSKKSSCSRLTWGFTWWQVLGSNQRRLSRRFTDIRRHAFDLRERTRGMILPRILRQVHAVSELAGRHGAAIRTTDFAEGRPVPRLAGRI